MVEHHPTHQRKRQSNHQLTCTQITPRLHRIHLLAEQMHNHSQQQHCHVCKQQPPPYQITIEKEIQRTEQKRISHHSIRLNLDIRATHQAMKLSHCQRTDKHKHNTKQQHMTAKTCWLNQYGTYYHSCIDDCRQGASNKIVHIFFYFLSNNLQR